MCIRDSPNAGYLPVPTFSTTGLAALGSGETYDLKLESQTAGGATVRLKIVTPATPSSTTVSYTHLDVYKRQPMSIRKTRISMP